MFIKLITDNHTGDNYIGKDDVVKVNTSNVTTNYVGDDTEGATQAYGIYIDKALTIEKNLELSGDLAIDDHVIQYKENN